MPRMPEVPGGARRRGQPSPAPAASCRTEVLVDAMLPRESSAPGRLQGMSIGSGLDSITILGSAHSNCFAEPLYNNHISLPLPDD